MRAFVILNCCLLFFAGCVPLLVGAGAVTGYVLSSDSAIGSVKTEYRTLWDVCLNKLHSLEAEIVQSDESQGLIKARISEHDVTVKIKNVSSDIQRLKVAARKFLLPKPQFAQKIFFSIVEGL